ncbi:MAG: HAMP domain-containing histidine kinase [Muribaculaceae bacterium]|nr:HAMP domain-containing histidine kinase [Muribaculaceae bacterium]
MLLGYNIYCLVELYRSISRQTTELITQSLRDADLDEILNRVKKYQTPETMPEYQGKTMSQSRSIEGDTLYITIVDDAGEVLEVRKSPLSPGTNYSDIMVNEIGYGAHQTIDPFYQLDMADLDSLFRLSLARKGFVPNVAFVTRVASDGTVEAGDSSLLGVGRLDSVSICYNIMTGECYTAYYSSPMGYILRQMLGIVVSTVAVIILITVAFCYLFMTVARLRTIEEMKDDFVSNMTHELKTPIAIAYSANDALINYDAHEDPVRRITYLKIANRQLRRLRELVENILAMSMERRKTMQRKPETIRLRPLVEEIAAAQRMRADKEIAIEVEIDQALLITADRSHLTNVLNNLIDNAIKYSGDSVVINIAGDDDGISVSDNGIGIPSKSIPYLFDRFYRVPHGNRQDLRGYGIGLYYVKSILDKMEWSVSVTSKEGEGSVFTIKFNGYEQ